MYKTPNSISGNTESKFTLCGCWSLTRKKDETSTKNKVESIDVGSVNVFCFFVIASFREEYAINISVNVPELLDQVTQTDTSVCYLNRIEDAFIKLLKQCIDKTLLGMTKKNRLQNVSDVTVVGSRDRDLRRCTSEVLKSIADDFESYCGDILRKIKRQMRDDIDNDGSLDECSVTYTDVTSVVENDTSSNTKIINISEDNDSLLKDIVSSEVKEENKNIVCSYERNAVLKKEEDYVNKIWNNSEKLVNEITFTAKRNIVTLGYIYSNVSPKSFISLDVSKSEKKKQTLQASSKIVHQSSLEVIRSRSRSDQDLENFRKFLDSFQNYSCITSDDFDWSAKGSPESDNENTQRRFRDFIEALKKYTVIKRTQNIETNNLAIFPEIIQLDNDEYPIKFKEFLKSYNLYQNDKKSFFECQNIYTYKISKIPTFFKNLTKMKTPRITKSDVKQKTNDSEPKIKITITDLENLRKKTNFPKIMMDKLNSFLVKEKSLKNFQNEELEKKENKEEKIVNLSSKHHQNSKSISKPQEKPVTATSYDLNTFLPESPLRPINPVNPGSKVSKPKPTSSQSPKKSTVKFIENAPVKISQVKTSKGILKNKNSSRTKTPSTSIVDYWKRSCLDIRESHGRFGLWLSDHCVQNDTRAAEARTISNSGVNCSDEVRRTFSGYILKKGVKDELNKSSVSLENLKLNCHVLLIRSWSGNWFKTQKPRFETWSTEEFTSFL